MSRLFQAGLGLGLFRRGGGFFIKSSPGDLAGLSPIMYATDASHRNSRLAQ